VTRDFRLLHLHNTHGRVAVPVNDFLHSTWHGVDHDLEASAVGRFQHSEESFMLYLVMKENLYQPYLFVCRLDPVLS
jgi:hypothetical protein